MRHQRTLLSGLPMMIDPHTTTGRAGGFHSRTGQMNLQGIPGDSPAAEKWRVIIPPAWQNDAKVHWHPPNPSQARGPLFQPKHVHWWARAV